MPRGTLVLLLVATACINGCGRVKQPEPNDASADAGLDGGTDAQRVDAGRDCGNIGGACSRDSDCCSGFGCAMQVVCQGPPCVPDKQPCQQSSDCCSRVCNKVDGGCQPL